MGKNPKKELFVIRDLDTLRVIADLLRKQILELLIREALTVKQVADRLGLAPSKLYYHFNLLETHGLVAVEGTRQVANMLEKWYRATAQCLEVDQALFAFSTDEGKQNIHTLVTATIDATRDDLLRSLEARAYQLEHGVQERPRRMVLTRQLSRISDRQADGFLERLQALTEEFEVADTVPADGEPRQAYALTLAYYPSFYFESEGEPQGGS